MSYQTEKEILHKLKNLVITKEAGPIGIPPVLLCWKTLVVLLFYIYKSVIDSVFPSVWNNARIAPVPP